MKITEFQPGDIIHRIQRGPNGDASWMGSPLKLIWVEGGVIFLSDEGRLGLGIGGTFTLSESEWADGWGLFPIKIAEQLGIYER